MKRFEETLKQTDIQRADVLKERESHIIILTNMTYSQPKLHRQRERVRKSVIHRQRQRERYIDKKRHKHRDTHNLV